MSLRTKLIATIGPSSDTYEMLKAFAEEGLDIARHNFSHATHEEFSARKAHFARIKEETGKNVLHLADLQGPRMRVGTLPDEGLFLEDGAQITFSTDKNDADAIYIDNPYLHLEIKVNDPLYLINGQIECSVTKIEGTRIVTRVVRGGRLFSKKGVNTPRTRLSIAGLSEKDMQDVKYVLNEGVDYIALSFVQSAEDIERLRGIVGTKAKIISKIETYFSLENIDNIIKASDGIMVARGDLGIEIPIEKIPGVQKHLIRLCMWHKKPVITATQMLVSMVDHPHPTRAEVSDVANAVWDGSDAVMLSEESANGKYPLESLRMLRKTVEEAERTIFTKGYSL